MTEVSNIDNDFIISKVQQQTIKITETSQTPKQIHFCTANTILKFTYNKNKTENLNAVPHNLNQTLKV